MVTTPTQHAAGTKPRLGKREAVALLADVVRAMPEGPWRESALEALVVVEFKLEAVMGMRRRRARGTVGVTP